MTESFSPQQQLKAFINTAQYLAGLTSGQDIWEEAGKLLVMFFGADVAALGQRSSDGKIEIGHRSFSEIGREVKLSEPEMIAAMRDVFESGFLTFMSSAASEPVAAGIFPILHENHVIAVMLVGHLSAAQMAKETLDLYLAAAGLIGATYSRRTSETGVLRAKEELEQRVAERTAELQAANAKMRDSRLAALNMMEDADIARRRAEASSLELQREMAERKEAEELLHKSRERLDLALASSRMATFDWDIVNNRRTWSDGVHSLLGTNPEAFTGTAEDFFRIIHPEDRSSVQSAISRAVEITGVYETEYRAVWPDGTIHYISARGKVHHDDAGRAILMTGVCWDITDRKQAEAALRIAHDELELRVKERTEDLATTVETLLGEMAERERAEGSLQRLNRLYAVLSETGQTIVRAPDRETLFRDFCRIAVEHGGFILSWVGLVDGASRQLKVMAASGATAYLDDIRITSNEEPEGEGPTGISIRNGTYYISNDFQNDPCTRPWHEKGRAHGIHSSASIALKEEGRVIGALTLYAGINDFFDQLHVELLQQLGADISFALNSFNQASRQKEAEQALQKETMNRIQALEELRAKEQLLIQQNRLAALGEMIGNIAHQWRQPLNVLGLILQELSFINEPGTHIREHLDGSIAKAMQIISHMSQTIDGFRNFFRPDKEKAPFDVQHIILRTVSLIESSLREQQIGVDIEVRDDLVIEGFPNEYSQVVLNILLNARDAFTEQKIDGPRFIRITLARENEKSVVTIADNAGGIPGEIMEKIFDPYFTTKGPDKGTGVGLFMSKTIIEKSMNGSLSACNSGEGATFRIEV